MLSKANCEARVHKKERWVLCLARVGLALSGEALSKVPFLCFFLWACKERKEDAKRAIYEFGNNIV